MHRRQNPRDISGVGRFEPCCPRFGRPWEAPTIPARVFAHRLQLYVLVETLHPDKTCMGRIATGFDFLGYHFSPDGLTMAKKTREHFVARVRQLDEQELGEGVSARLGAYVRWWAHWVRAGRTTTAPLHTVKAQEVGP